MWLISLVAVIFCSYFLAKIVTNLISMQFQSSQSAPVLSLKSRAQDSLSSKASKLEDFEDILKRNIFDSNYVYTPRSNNEEDPSKKAPEKKEVVKKVDLDAEAIETKLPIKLLSTFSVGAGRDKRSSSIIDAGGRNSQEVYTVDDEKEFAPGTKIVRILYNRVEFTNKGRLEYVKLEDFTEGVNMNVPPPRDIKTSSSRQPKKSVREETKIEQAGEGKFLIDRAEIDNALANLDKLYTQVRAVPHFKNGKPNGLKLLSVRSKSIFSKLGLKRGDILLSINDMELDIKKGLELFNKLKSETNITIELERRGKTQEFEYEIR